MKNEEQNKTPENRKGHKPTFILSLRRSGLMFLSVTPMLIAVIGLAALFQVYVTPEMLATTFSGNPLFDTFFGTLAAAAASGNPMVSYVLGGELLKQGISLYAVTAFILSWVTLGFVHLPAEAEVFGLRFTVCRNLLTLFGTMAVAVATAFTVKVLQ